MARGIKPQERISGNPISLGKASRKYSIPKSTLSDWAERGDLVIIRRPGSRGQAMLVDEASVLVARETHRRGYEQGGSAISSAEVLSRINSRPAIKVKYDTAELVEAYHHYGESIGFRPDTMEKNRIILRKFTEKCPVLPTTPEAILTFIHNLEVGMTRKKTYYTVIRAFYNFLEDFHSIPTPLKKRMVPRADRHPYIRVLSREEVLKLLNVAESYQEKMMLETLYITRVRVGELVSMTSDNLFPDHVVVEGKTGRWEVPITPELYASLSMLGEGQLFRNRSGKPITRDGVYHRVEKCMKAAGIKGKKLGPHTLRHTSLTHLYEDTGDIKLVQDAARHADIRMTMVYTHPRASKQKEKLLKHDPIARLGPVLRPGPGQSNAEELAEVLKEAEG